MIGASTIDFAPEHGAGVDEGYLVVLEEGSSAIHRLPSQGELVIGRAADADLRLAAPAASRRHARLQVVAGDVLLSDLGSHNGTQLNGQTIHDVRVLTGGDVLTICGTSLVFCRRARGPRSRPVRDEGYLRQRLEEEVDRSLRHRRPLTLLCVEIGGAPERARLAAALAPALQLGDVVAWGAAGPLWLLLPELGEEEVQEAAARVSAALTPLGLPVRLGIAGCPADGCTSDDLLQAARAAAELAPPGGSAVAGAVARVEEIGGHRLVAADPAMVRLLGLLRRLAQSDLPVLVYGETGAGKEIAASVLHHGSRRREQRLVSLNCAALPESLVESELFGHERGAFSGAVAQKIGLLESAAGGTLFLDEVGELSPAVQAKLLRALETRRITRVGEVREREVDIRVVAATNRNLHDDVRAGRFREDLLYRLSAATVVLPPLRERRREIPILARTFLQEACERAGQPAPALSAASMQELLDRRWPGNVRELRNAMEYLAATVSEPVVEPWHLPRPQGEPPPGAAAPRFRPIEEEVQELEIRRMLEALSASGGHHRRAAELIQMPLRTFATKYRRYGLALRAGRAP